MLLNVVIDNIECWKCLIHVLKYFSLLFIVTLMRILLNVVNGKWMLLMLLKAENV